MEGIKKMHLQVCKDEALQALKDGVEPTEVWAGFAQKMIEDPKTKQHPGLQMGVSFMMINQLSTKDQVESFIKGFN